MIHHLLTLAATSLSDIVDIQGMLADVRNFLLLATTTGAGVAATYHGFGLATKPDEHERAAHWRGLRLTGLGAAIGIAATGLVEWLRAYVH